MSDGSVAVKQYNFQQPYYQQPVQYVQPTPPDQMAIVMQQFNAQMYNM
jgi:hypothetical protein